jgi:hypothetical protein
MRAGGQSRRLGLLGACAAHRPDRRHALRANRRAMIDNGRDCPWLDRGRPSDYFGSRTAAPGPSRTAIKRAVQPKQIAAAALCLAERENTIVFSTSTAASTSPEFFTISDRRTHTLTSRACARTSRARARCRFPFNRSALRDGDHSGASAPRAHRNCPSGGPSVAAKMAPGTRAKLTFHDPLDVDLRAFRNLTGHVNYRLISDGYKFYKYRGHGLATPL